jgi:hypothetical protein
MQAIPVRPLWPPRRSSGNCQGLKAWGNLFPGRILPAALPNFLTRRLVVHPDENRFYSQDLRDKLRMSGLLLEKAFEFKMIGIIAMCRKTSVVS